MKYFIGTYTRWDYDYDNLINNCEYEKESVESAMEEATKIRLQLDANKDYDTDVVVSVEERTFGEPIQRFMLLRLSSYNTITIMDQNLKKWMGMQLVLLRLKLNYYN